MIYEMRLRVIAITDLKKGDVPIMVSIAGEDPRVLNTRPAVLEFYNGMEWKKVEITIP